MDFEPTNPDTAALTYIAEILEELEVEFPDGGIAEFRQIDQGFTSKPVYNPYVSLQIAGSRAPLVRLGQGAGVTARNFEIDVLVSIEYEDVDATRGAHRVAQMRWDVFRHLIEHANKFPGVEIAEFDEAYVTSFNADDGTFQEWGYIAQIVIPLTVVIKGTSL